MVKDIIVSMIEQQAAKELLEAIENSSLTLLVGSTASGKSVLVFSYYKYLVSKFNPEEWRQQAGYDAAVEEQHTG